EKAGVSYTDLTLEGNKEAKEAKKEADREKLAVLKGALFACDYSKTIEKGQFENWKWISDFADILSKHTDIKPPQSTLEDLCQKAIKNCSIIGKENFEIFFKKFNEAIGKVVDTGKVAEKVDSLCQLAIQSQNAEILAFILKNVHESYKVQLAENLGKNKDFV